MQLIPPSLTPFEQKESGREAAMIPGMTAAASSAAAATSYPCPRVPVSGASTVPLQSRRLVSRLSSARDRPLDSAQIQIERARAELKDARPEEEEDERGPGTQSGSHCGPRMGSSPLNSVAPVVATHHIPTSSDDDDHHDGVDDDEEQGEVDEDASGESLPLSEREMIYERSLVCHAPRTLLWKALMNKIRHPERYTGSRDVKIVSEGSDFLFREVSVGPRDHEHILREKVTWDESESGVRFTLYDDEMKHGYVENSITTDASGNNCLSVSCHWVFLPISSLTRQTLRLWRSGLKRAIDESITKTVVIVEEEFRQLEQSRRKRRASMGSMHGIATPPMTPAAHSTAASASGAATPGAAAAASSSSSSSSAATSTGSTNQSIPMTSMRRAITDEKQRQFTFQQHHQQQQQQQRQRQKQQQQQQQHLQTAPLPNVVPSPQSKQ